MSKVICHVTFAKLQHCYGILSNDKLQHCLSSLPRYFRYIATFFLCLFTRGTFDLSELRHCHVTYTKLQHHLFFINDNEIEIKKSHKYLGFLLDCNGNFNQTMNDLANKGKRALYSIYKLSTIEYISITTMLQVFETTIKPILLYGSEIWGYQSKIDNKIERVQTMFGKHILGVHRKSTNAAVLGELGIRTLNIDMQINTLKFYDYLEQNKNNLIKDALLENINDNTPWYRNIKTLNDELHFDRNLLFNKDSCKDDKTYKELTQKNNKLIKKFCKKQLTSIHDEEWKNKILQMSKMKFIRNLNTNQH